jgi:hypothetical protein
MVKLGTKVDCFTVCTMEIKRISSVGTDVGHLFDGNRRIMGAICVQLGGYQSSEE